MNPPCIGAIIMLLWLHNGVLRYQQHTFPLALGETLFLATVTLALYGAWAVCPRDEHCHVLFHDRFHDPLSENSSPPIIYLTLLYALPMMGPLLRACAILSCAVEPDAEAHVDPHRCARVKVWLRFFCGASHSRPRTQALGSRPGPTPQTTEESARAPAAASEACSPEECVYAPALSPL
jgi:hypothetical protein